MNDILKQRLVGALILIALGVVFWPIIFVEPTDRVVLEPGRVPLPPEIDTRPIAAPGQGDLRASPERTAREQQTDDWVLSDDEVVSAPEPATQEPESATEQPAEPVSAEPVKARSEPPQQAALDVDGVPIAWILQVASVSSAQKAEELRVSLLAMDDKAYVKKVSSGGKELYRVYIGPNFERAKLEKIKGTVDTRFGVQSIIVRYLP